MFVARNLLAVSILLNPNIGTFLYYIDIILNIANYKHTHCVNNNINASIVSSNNKAY